MKQKYEYKFVRVGERIFGPDPRATLQYQQVVEEHARDGWRLVQVFTPSLGGLLGKAPYLELILEREIE